MPAHPRFSLLRLATAIVAWGACARSTPSTRPAPSAGEDGRVLDSATFNRANPGRLEELIASRLAGVRLVRRSDGSAALRIRDAGSLNGDGEPLFVVDGLPLSPRTRLDFLNLTDVVRIEMLKDPASTAAYGLRGVNGVILITTRRY